MSFSVRVLDVLVLERINRGFMRHSPWGNVEFDEDKKI
jgi:hypothetical protein